MNVLTNVMLIYRSLSCMIYSYKNKLGLWLKQFAIEKTEIEAYI